MKISGCHTFAYDHTINAPPNRGNNIKYFKTGLGIGPSLKTLKELMIDNNHENSTIDYLKVCTKFLKSTLLYPSWTERKFPSRLTSKGVNLRLEDSIIGLKVKFWKMLIKLHLNCTWTENKIRGYFLRTKQTQFRNQPMYFLPIQLFYV